MPVGPAHQLFIPTPPKQNLDHAIVECISELKQQQQVICVRVCARIVPQFCLCNTISSECMQVSSLSVCQAAARARVCVCVCVCVRQAPAWVQVAVLSGYDRPVIGAMCAAVRASTAHEHLHTGRCLKWSTYQSPMGTLQIARMLHGRLLGNAMSGGNAYTSWHTPHPRGSAHSCLVPGAWRSVRFHLGWGKNQYLPGHT